MSAPAETEVKTHIITMCHEVIAILDGTKWGRVGVASFAQLEAIQRVITDSRAPADLVDSVRDLGIEVMLV